MLLLFAILIFFVQFTYHQTGDHEKYRSGTKTMIGKRHIISFKCSVLSFKYDSLTGIDVT